MSDNDRGQREATDRNREDCFNGHSAFSGYAFSDDDGKTPLQTHVCMEFARHFDPDCPFGLMLYGEGAGKTFRLASIANSLLDKGFTVKFLTADETGYSPMDSMTDEERKSYLEDLARYDLVIIDNFGTKRRESLKSDWANAVVTARSSAGKPMVIESRVTPTEMRGTLPDITWRKSYEVLLETCLPVDFGDDRSRLSERAERTRKEMARRLGIDK